MIVQTCKAVAIEPGRLTTVELPVRDPGPDEVLVRVRACALCTWEQRTYSGAQPPFKPLLGGHEVAGEVVDVGAGVKGLVKPGDHVAVARLGRCGYCRPCREGRDAHCENSYAINDYGDYFGPAGLSEYLTVPAYQVFPVDAGLSFEEASLTEPVSCVLRSVRRARVDFGDDALISGAGIMGALHLAMLRARGVRPLVAEVDPTRRAKALALGAAAVLDPTFPGYEEELRSLTTGGPAAVFVTGGGKVALEQAMRLVAVGGRVVVYAAFYPEPTLELPSNPIHHNEVELIGTMSQSSEEFYRAAALLSKRIIDVRPLITETYPIAQVQQAFERALSLETYRVVVTL